ncbi:MAG: pyridoxal phosphate-dependent aminotransferase [Candidatus Thorarchaeota archaeon]
MNLGYSDQLNEFVRLARQNPNIIDLSMCDPPRFGFLPDRTIYSSDDIREYEQGYPDPHNQLIHGIVSRTREFTGQLVDESEVLITNGLAGAFASLAISLHGLTIGIQSPFYAPLYEFFRKTMDLWYFRCTPELEWAVDIDLLRKDLEVQEKNRVLVVVTPNNPTGHVLSRREMIEIIDLAGEYDQILLSDEVYDEMSFVPFTSALGISKDVPVIYTHGFSKVWRAPEIRLGFMILHDPEMKATLEFSEIRRISNLGFGVNPNSQLKGIQLLRESKEFRAKQFEELQRRRDALNAAIRESANLKGIPAKGATYQLIQTPWNDWELCQYLAEEHNYLISPASAFDQFIGDNYIRMVFLNKAEYLVDCVRKIDQMK